MTFTAPSRCLPAVLWFDAASAAATGALQLAAAPLLASAFGLPQPLLLASGIVLLGVASFAAWLARARPLRRRGVLALAGINAAWVAGCAELLFAGSAGTALGSGWLAMQALAVGALAVLEWLGVRGDPQAAAA